MEYDVRWKQRFENFDRALTLLREPFQRNVDALSALEKEGTVQRFEYTLELAWTTMKDLLQHEGRLLPSVTPRSVVKEAFAAGLVQEGQVWIDMIDHRNPLSHSYDALRFAEAVVAIRDRYLSAMTELHALLTAKAAS